MTPLGYGQITQLAGAKGFSVLPIGIPAGAQMALLQAETQNVRWRDDGTAPTASVGMLLRTTDPPFWYRGNLQNLKFIAAAAGGILNVTFYGG